MPACTVSSETVRIASVAAAVLLGHVKGACAFKSSVFGGVASAAAILAGPTCHV